MIDKIRYDDIVANLRYTDSSGGNIEIKSKKMYINTNIHTGDEYINISVDKFNYFNKDVHFAANIILDSKKNKLFLDSKIDIKDDLSVNIYAKSDTKRLDYTIKSNKTIPSTSYLVSILNMDPRVIYWVDTAINMDGLDLKQAYGFIEYDKSNEALKNFYAYGIANSLEYTYDQKLDSIKTKYTDLFFKDGVLFILPNDSKTYDFNLDASWLRIDFTKPQEILTLHLLFDGIVDKNLKNLLNHYKIKLPFVQKSGYMDTNLILSINLISLDVDAKGTFYTNKANFNYLGLDLDLSDTLVELHNFDVNIPKMSAKYKNIAIADVNANLDLKSGHGTIDFALKKLSFGEELKLNTNKSPLNVKYLISPEQDKVELANSKWLLNKQNVELEALSIPFNLDKLTAQIPTAEISVDNLLTAYISGSANLKKIKFDLDVDLIKFKYDDFKLAQSNAPLRAIYENNKIIFLSKGILNLTANKQNIKIKKLNVEYNNGSIHAKSSKAEIENLLTTGFNVSYSFNDKDGYLRLNKLNFKNDALGKIFKKNNNIDFNIKSTNEQFVINASSLNISAFITPEQWVIAFNALDKLKPYSPFLSKYQIDSGKFSIYKRKNEKNIKFLANIDYKYKFLHINEKPISNYIIKGQVNNNNDTLISLNNKLDISISNGVIGIIGDNVGINLNRIIDLTNKINSTNEKPSDSYISLSLDNSYIFLSDERRV
ncbi:MAG: hypothetical protein OQJ77_00755, partial [Thiovulaceae bacterium]|nr:hypothetical protein [Sulfurimonadaceae bacterium]